MNSTTSPPCFSCQTPSKFFSRELNNFQLLKKSVNNPCRSSSDLFSPLESPRKHTQKRETPETNFKTGGRPRWSEHVNNTQNKQQKLTGKKKKKVSQTLQFFSTGSLKSLPLEQLCRERERAEGSERLGQLVVRVRETAASSERKEGRKARASEAGPTPQSLTRETTVLSFTQLCVSLLLSFEGS